MKDLFGYDFIRPSDRAWVIRWFDSRKARDAALEIVRKNFDPKAGRTEPATDASLVNSTRTIEPDMDDGYVFTIMMP